MSDIKKLTDTQLNDAIIQQTAIMSDLVYGLMGCKTSTDDFTMDGDGVFYTWLKLRELNTEFSKRYYDLKRQEP